MLEPQPIVAARDRRVPRVTNVREVARRCLNREELHARIVVPRLDERAGAVGGAEIDPDEKRRHLTISLDWVGSGSAGRLVVRPAPRAVGQLTTSGLLARPELVEGRAWRHSRMFSSSFQLCPPSRA